MLRAAALVFWKDLVVEARAREVLAPMVFFGALVVLVASFALVGDGTPPPDVAGGILWIAVAFAGSLGISRAFEREREGETFRALLLGPAPRSAVYMGKLASVLCFMVVVEAVVVPMVALFFGAAIGAHPIRLAALMLLGTLGYAAAGALFGAALIRTRGRDVLLGVLLYPITIPVLIAGSKGTAALLESPAALPTADTWIKFLVALDTIFLVVALWAFEPLCEEP